MYRKVGSVTDAELVNQALNCIRLVLRWQLCSLDVYVVYVLYTTYLVRYTRLRNNYYINSHCEPRRQRKIHAGLTA